MMWRGLALLCLCVREGSGPPGPVLESVGTGVAPVAPSGSYNRDARRPATTLKTPQPGRRAYRTLGGRCICKTSLPSARARARPALCLSIHDPSSVIACYVASLRPETFILYFTDLHVWVCARHSMGYGRVRHHKDEVRDLPDDLRVGDMYSSRARNSYDPPPASSRSLSILQAAAEESRPRTVWTPSASLHFKIRHQCQIACWM